MFKLILTDLDDTLIPYVFQRRSVASPRSIAAIDSALEQGIHFGPVSGRIPGSMSWMFDGHDECCQTGAFVNGQVIRVDGKVVKTVAFDTDVLRQLRLWLDKADAGCFLTIFDLSEETKPAVVTSHPERVMKSGSCNWGEFRRVVSELGEGPYVKANLQCACERPQMEQVRDALSVAFPQLSFVFPSNVAPIIDITPANWDKGSAVRFIAEYLGISLDEVVVFGDSDNDLAMIDSVPNSVAVANASPTVAEHATWHIGPSSEYSVASAIEQIAGWAQGGKKPDFLA